VEALAAMLFLAIVIPVAVQALQIASRAGTVALRKSEAARVADHLLGEMVATGQWKQGGRGTVREGLHEFAWSVDSKAWDKDALKLVTLRVVYNVQNREYDVQVSTLVDANQQ
jgi:type II secretory pathway pseudopilin PulG